MKRLFALLALIPLLAFGAANDIQISQINAAGTAAVAHLFQPASGTQFTTLAGFNTALGFGTGDSPVLTGLTLSGIATTRVPFATTGGALTSSSALTFNSGTGVLSATGFAGSGASLTGLVTSITGTPNQIAASASTGAVTISIPTNPTLPGNVTTTGNVTVVGSANAFNVAAGVTPATELEVDSTSTSSPRGIMTAQFNTGADGARLHMRKARGTRASPTTVVTGDNLGRIVGTGYDGTSYLEDTSIIFGTEGTIASTRVPTNIQFLTATDAAPSVLTQALILKSDQSATFAKNITFGTAGSILSGTTGSQGITVTGTNQDWSITPTGTGSVIFAIPGTTQSPRVGRWSDATTFGVITLNGGLSSTTYMGMGGGGDARLYFGGPGPIDFRPGYGLAGTFTTTLHLLLGGLTTDGTGVLQFPAATTSAGGITFGTDALVYRTAADTLTIPSNVTFGPNDAVLSASSGGNFSIVSSAAHAIILKPAGTTALTLDSSQNATFAGTVKSSGFARVTADATNATATMSNLTNMSVTVASGTKYIGTIQIFGVDSTNTDGLAFDLGGGSATFTDLEFGFSAQPAGSTLGTVTSTTSTTAITLTVVSTSDAVYTISFGFTCNAGGTFIPRFSQVVHSTGTATVRKNSGINLVASTN